MANLDISEKRLPQDGRFTFKANGQKLFDCRISTCPTLFGEKLVVRILNAENFVLTIEQLGLGKKQQELFGKAIQSPQGMILVTGPTGSGKTITLYTALSILNAASKNISTAEDPVEINLYGVNQVEVNSKICLGFDKVLRAFLRQDPNVIMIGELRDLDTAKIAIQAAQTGHLVLSTLHTNSACESVTRLLSLGISSYDLATTITLIVAQRLVRKLCTRCNLIGCEHCKNGYKGRLGVFEVLPITKSISEMIMQNCSSIEIEKQARSEGMQTLREIALAYVSAGLTTLSEVNRVIL